MKKAAVRGYPRKNGVEKKKKSGYAGLMEYKGCL